MIYPDRPTPINHSSAIVPSEKDVYGQSQEGRVQAYGADNIYPLMRTIQDVNFFTNRGCWRIRPKPGYTYNETMTDIVKPTI
jgi:hypothetical protein